MNRRTILKGGLVVASATPAAAWAPPRIDELAGLIKDYETSVRLDKAAWEAATEKAYSDAMKAAPVERVQIGRLSHGIDSEGERIFSPIFAYSLKEIEAYYHENHQVQLMFVGKSPEAVLKAEEKTRKLVGDKVSQFNELVAESCRIKDECGYTKTHETANATADAVRAVENAIINFVPQTLDDAARKARWIVAELDSGRGYLNDREYVDLLLDALMPIGRAA